MYSLVPSRARSGKIQRLVATGFGPDPYLTGIAMAQTINGMQAAGVQACAKHYIGNEQEKNRETMSSNIGDRVNHELYLWYV
jgi:beta-glucosidase